MQYIVRHTQLNPRDENDRCSIQRCIVDAKTPDEAKEIVQCGYNHVYNVEPHNSPTYDALKLVFSDENTSDAEKVSAMILLAEMADAGKTLHDFVWRREIEEQARDCDDLLETQEYALGRLW